MRVTSVSIYFPFDINVPTYKHNGFEPTCSGESCSEQTRQENTGLVIFSFTNVNDVKWYIMISKHQHISVFVNVCRPRPCCCSKEIGSLGHSGEEICWCSVSFISLHPLGSGAVSVGWNLA